MWRPVEAFRSSIIAPLTKRSRHLQANEYCTAAFPTFGGHVHPYDVYGATAPAPAEALDGIQPKVNKRVGESTKYPFLSNGRVEFLEERAAPADSDPVDEDWLSSSRPVFDATAALAATDNVAAAAAMVPAVLQQLKAEAQLLLRCLRQHQRLEAAVVSAAIEESHSNSSSSSDRSISGTAAAAASCDLLSVGEDMDTKENLYKLQRYVNTVLLRFVELKDHPVLELRLFSLSLMESLLLIEGRAVPLSLTVIFACLKHGCMQLQQQQQRSTQQVQQCPIQQFQVQQERQYEQEQQFQQQHKHQLGGLHVVGELSEVTAAVKKARGEEVLAALDVMRKFVHTIFYYSSFAAARLRRAGAAGCRGVFFGGEQACLEGFQSLVSLREFLHKVLKLCMHCNFSIPFSAVGDDATPAETLAANASPLLLCRCYRRCLAIVERSLELISHRPLSPLAAEAEPASSSSCAGCVAVATDGSVVVGEGVSQSASAVGLSHSSNTNLAAAASSSSPCIVSAESTAAGLPRASTSAGLCGREDCASILGVTPVPAGNRESSVPLQRVLPTFSSKNVKYIEDFPLEVAADALLLKTLENWATGDIELLLLLLQHRCCNYHHLQRQRCSLEKKQPRQQHQQQQQERSSFFQIFCGATETSSPSSGEPPPSQQQVRRQEEKEEAALKLQPLLYACVLQTVTWLCCHRPQYLTCFSSVFYSLAHELRPADVSHAAFAARATVSPSTDSGGNKAAGMTAAVVGDYGAVSAAAASGSYFEEDLQASSFLKSSSSASRNSTIKAGLGPVVVGLRPKTKEEQQRLGELEGWLQQWPEEARKSLLLVLLLELLRLLASPGCVAAGFQGLLLLLLRAAGKEGSLQVLTVEARSLFADMWIAKAPPPSAAAATALLSNASQPTGGQWCSAAQASTRRKAAAGQEAVVPIEGGGAAAAEAAGGGDVAEASNASSIEGTFDAATTGNKIARLAAAAAVCAEEKLAVFEQQRLWEREDDGRYELQQHMRIDAISWMKITRSKEEMVELSLQALTRPSTLNSSNTARTRALLVQQQAASQHELQHCSAETHPPALSSESSACLPGGALAQQLLQESESQFRICNEADDDSSSGFKALSLDSSVGTSSLNNTSSSESGLLRLPRLFDTHFQAEEEEQLQQPLNAEDWQQLIAKDGSSKAAATAAAKATPVEKHLEGDESGEDERDGQLHLLSATNCLLSPNDMTALVQPPSVRVFQTHARLFKRLVFSQLTHNRVCARIAGAEDYGEVLRLLRLRLQVLLRLAFFPTQSPSEQKDFCTALLHALFAYRLLPAFSPPAASAALQQQQQHEDVLLEWQLRTDALLDILYYKASLDLESLSLFTPKLRFSSSRSSSHLPSAPISSQAAPISAQAAPISSKVAPISSKVAPIPAQQLVLQQPAAVVAQPSPLACTVGGPAPVVPSVGFAATSSAFESKNLLPSAAESVFSTHLLPFSASSSSASVPASALSAQLPVPPVAVAAAADYGGFFGAIKKQKNATEGVVGCGFGGDLTTNTSPNNEADITGGGGVTNTPSGNEGGVITSIAVNDETDISSGGVTTTPAVKDETDNSSGGVNTTPAVNDEADISGSVTTTTTSNSGRRRSSSSKGSGSIGGSGGGAADFCTVEVSEKTRGIAEEVQEKERMHMEVAAQEGVGQQDSCCSLLVADIFQGLACDCVSGESGGFSETCSTKPFQKQTRLPAPTPKDTASPTATSFATITSSTASSTETTASSTETTASSTETTASSIETTGPPAAAAVSDVSSSTNHILLQAKCEGLSGRCRASLISQQKLLLVLQGSLPPNPLVGWPFLLFSGTEGGEEAGQDKKKGALQHQLFSQQQQLQGPGVVVEGTYSSIKDRQLQKQIASHHQQPQAAHHGFPPLHVHNPEENFSAEQPPQQLPHHHPPKPQLLPQQQQKKEEQIDRASCAAAAEGAAVFLSSNASAAVVAGQHQKKEMLPTQQHQQQGAEAASAATAMRKTHQPSFTYAEVFSMCLDKLYSPEMLADVKKRDTYCQILARYFIDAPYITAAGFQRIADFSCGPPTSRRLAVAVLSQLVKRGNSILTKRTAFSLILTLQHFRHEEIRRLFLKIASSPRGLYHLPSPKTTACDSGVAEDCFEAETGLWQEPRCAVLHRAAVLAGQHLQQHKKAQDPTKTNSDKLGSGVVMTALGGSSTLAGAAKNSVDLPTFGAAQAKQQALRPVEEFSTARACCSEAADIRAGFEADSVIDVTEAERRGWADTQQFSGAWVEQCAGLVMRSCAAADAPFAAPIKANPFITTLAQQIIDRISESEASSITSGGVREGAAVGGVVERIQLYLTLCTRRPKLVHAFLECYVLADRHTKLIFEENFQKCISSIKPLFHPQYVVILQNYEAEQERLVVNLLEHITNCLYINAAIEHSELHAMRDCIWQLLQPEEGVDTTRQKSARRLALVLLAFYTREKLEVLAPLIVFDDFDEITLKQALKKVLTLPVALQQEFHGGAYITGEQLLLIFYNLPCSTREERKKQTGILDYCLDLTGCTAKSDACGAILSVDAVAAMCQRITDDDSQPISVIFGRLLCQVAQNITSLREFLAGTVMPALVRRMIWSNKSLWKGFLMAMSILWAEQKDLLFKVILLLPEGEGKDVLRHLQQRHAITSDMIAFITQDENTRRSCPPYLRVLLGLDPQ